MKRAVLVCVVAFVVCNCAAERDGLRDLDGYELAGAVVVESSAEGPAIAIEGSMCACETDDCARQWVLDNLGCDICVHVRCDGGWQATCALCPRPAARIGPATRLAAGY